MKVTALTLWLAILTQFGSAFGFRVFAQLTGTFVNLNFESANVPVVPPDGFGANVAIRDAIPGWTVYGGGAAEHQSDPSDEIRHNNISLGGSAIIIYGPEWKNASEILSGSYSLSLQTVPVPLPFRVAIGQTGQIPEVAKSLIFYSWPEPLLTITFAGQTLPFIRLQRAENYDVFGADISAFAGQTGELRFTAGTPGKPVARVLLDDIRFSTITVGPWLAVERKPGGVRISWPRWAEAYTLESAQKSSGEWSAVAAEPVSEGTFLTLTVNASEGLKFYRLLKR